MSNFIESTSGNDKKIKKSTTNPPVNKQSPTNKRKTKVIESNLEPLAQIQKRHSKNSQPKNVDHKPNSTNNIDSRVDFNTHSHISTQLNSTSNHLQQTSNPHQLVPIHIPFFKWEINVDTLVRLFIFA
jgi:hypothetical protein